MCVGESLVDLRFGLADLSDVRRLVLRTALDADLTRDQADRLALAVNEVATNAIVHGRPPRTLRLCREDRGIVCEIADAGPGIKDRRAGLERPPPQAVGGRGLWLARQLCDAVEIRNGTGCTVALRLAAPVAEPVASR